jgi:Fe-S cluster biosynthesis and repair protein YggX
LLTKRKSSEIATKLLKELGSKKQWKQWCSENNITINELEEFMNNAIKYARLKQNEKVRKFFRRRG